MQLTTKNILYTLLLMFLLVNKAEATEPAPAYSDLLLDDIQFVLLAPARWETQEWKNLGWASAAVVGTAIFIDTPLRDETQRQNGRNSFFRTFERLGAEYSIGVIGGFYLAGSLSNNETAIRVAEDTLTASIIASAIITPAIKIVAGRSRPYKDFGNNNFQGPGFKQFNSSFPSGHTTEAFALASVISAHYEESWIKYTVYSAASLVGFARIYNDAHFASDVLAGAFIGTLVGQSVVAHNQSRRGSSVILVPETAQNFVGLRLTGIF